MLLILAAAVAVAGIAASPAQPSTSAALAPTVLDLRVVRQDGTTDLLRQLVGNAPSIVAFWASYCAPCQAEVPALNRAADRWHGRGLHVVGVALETDEKRVGDTRKEWGIRYDVVRLAPGQDDLLDRLFPRGLPVTAFVARGELALHEHVIDDAELDRRAPELLTEAPAR